MSILRVGSADSGPKVRADLRKQGWTMGEWRTQDLKRYTSPGTFGDFTVYVSYLKGFGQTDVIASTPCLKGSPLTESSLFPQPGSTQSR
ncbi:hypothetical protein [Streptomyces mangrovisoli]|nr:hypothetical protein [Streptomyces mangrovisoli]